MTALTCPFCNTAFDLPSLPGRVVCPRCGEAIPAKMLPAKTGPAITAAERQGPSETAPGRLGLRPVTLFGILLLVGSLVGLGLWYSSTSQKPDSAGSGSKAPPATRPPNALPGLLRLPPETQIALALQPAPLIQYAERVGLSPEAMLAELGLPVGLVSGLKNAGIPPESIDHLVLGVSLSESPLPRLSMALFLREPIAGERHFREAVKFRQNADKPGRAKVDLPGIPLPMEMLTVDATTYLFSSDERSLDGMAKPKENADFLKLGLRESIRKVDPASFAWVATDNLAWADLPTLKLLAPLIQQPDLPKRLKGIRAIALGLTLRPELAAQGSVRFADPKAAGEFETRAKPKLAETKIAMERDEEWVSLTMPGVSFANGIPAILGLFEK